MSGFTQHAKKRDLNEPEIVVALRALGYVVILLDEPCDLLVQCSCGQWQPLEVKNLAGRGRRLTSKQTLTLDVLHLPIPVVTNVEEARIAMCVHRCD